MSCPDPAERLARKLPPDGVRRILARLESLLSRGDAGEVCRIMVGEDGELQVVVEEVYGWRKPHLQQAKGA